MIDYHNIFRSKKILTKILTSLYNISYISCIVLMEFMYYCFHNNRLTMIKTVTHKIEKFNIIYLKLFQIICMNNAILNNNEQYYLLQYTDNIKYTQDEIDYERLNLLKNDKNIYIEDIPMNCGIIAIVYKGKYKDKDIVVKILKNNIKSKINAAISDLELLFNIIKYIPYFSLFKLDKLLEYNKDVLLEQIDFENEKKNINIFRDKYKRSKWLKIPEVFSDITNSNNLSNIIVMEYIKGDKITNLVDEIDKIEISKLISKFTISGLLFHNVVHLDIHIGNIFCIKAVDNDNNIIYKLGVIDFGMIALPSRENQNLYYNFINDIFINKDCKNAIRILLEHNVCEPKDILINMSPNMLLNLKKELIEATNVCIKSNDINIIYIYQLISILNKYDLFLNRELAKVMITFAVSIEVIKAIDSEWQNNLLSIIEGFSNIYKMIEI